MSLPTKSWWKMAEIYKIFAVGYTCDFSLKSAQELFDHESGRVFRPGTGVFINEKNGYAIGKKWCDVQVKAWLYDLEKPDWYWVLKNLYSDGLFPHWWLNKIFKNFIDSKKELYSDAPDRIKKNLKKRLECLTEVSVWSGTWNHCRCA